jgi:serine/threonine kinase 3
LQKEIDILADARDCKYVVQFFGCYLKENTLMLVMEFCDGGSALDIIQMAERNFTEDQAAAVLADMLKGLVYLHEHRVLHRDLKAANVLLTKDGIAKLADFGVSAKLAYTMQRRGTVVGSPYWMAPEVINVNDEDEEEGYDLMADIWSLGITAIELVQGEPPLFHIQQLRVIFLIPNRDPPRLEEPGKWSDEFNNFVESCLQKDPSKRKSPQELVGAHPFALKGEKNHDVLVDLMKEVGPILDQKRAEKREENLEGDSDDMGPGTMIKAGTRSGDTIGTFDTIGSDGYGTFVVNEGDAGSFGDVQVEDL